MGCPSPAVRPWARRRINHWSMWRMASATPDLRLPSQPHGIIVHCLPVPNYTAWWQRHMCVNNLPNVVTWKRNGWDSNPRPFESQVQRSNHYAIRPHRGLLNIYKRAQKLTDSQLSLPHISRTKNTRRKALETKTTIAQSIGSKRLRTN